MTADELDAAFAVHVRDEREAVNQEREDLRQERADIAAQCAQLAFDDAEGLVIESPQLALKTETA